MPIYEYGCRACGHKTDILHGIHDTGPQFCPECGAEGTMRKGIAVPAIVFKGSGWAKKDRGSASRTKAAAREESGSTSSSDSKSGSPDSGASESKSGSSAAAASESKSGKPESGSAGSSSSSSRPAND